MAFSVWLLLGGSVAYWALQLFPRALPMPPGALAAADARGAQVDLGRLLGVTPVQVAAPEVAASTRLRLLGVVAPRNPQAAEAGEGVALIEVDGVPRTVRVGAVVDGELRLLRVEARSASLGLVGQAPTQVIQLSPPPDAATGSLPPAAPSPVVLGGNPPGTVARMPPQAPPVQPPSGNMNPPVEPPPGVPLREGPGPQTR